MSPRLALATAALAGTGSSLLCSTFRWGRHRSLSDRLASYVPGTPIQTARPRVGSALLSSLVPIADAVGRAVDRMGAAPDELALRLARTGSPLDPVGHRVRQLMTGMAGLLAGAAIASVVRPPPTMTGIVLAAGAGIGVLLPEQRLSAASARSRRDVEGELPAVIEQLATMVDAGLSTHAALQRVADRRRGPCADGFRTVAARIRQGVGEREALDEWAALAGVDGARRLAAVLTLPTADLGRLLETEAIQLRRDAHRRLIDVIERRAQQVWIPVTVATLLPGVLFLAVPFIEAMRLFSAA